MAQEPAAGDQPRCPVPGCDRERLAVHWEDLRGGQDEGDGEGDRVGRSVGTAVGPNGVATGLVGRLADGGTGATHAVTRRRTAAETAPTVVRSISPPGRLVHPMTLVQPLV